MRRRLATLSTFARAGMVLALAVAPLTAAWAACVANPAAQPDASFPGSLTGKLVYHSYVSYGDGSSQLFIYDFAAHSLTQVSRASWGISDPMNASFSPDGKWLLFMGVKNQSWNVFLWPVDNSHAPYALTDSRGDALNEDPKFAADGQSIVFKRDGVPVRAKLALGKTPSIGTPVAMAGSDAQRSMPFLSPNGAALYYAKGDGGADLGVYVRDLASGKEVAFDAAKGLSTYYPIVRADGMVFYTKWNNARGQLDRLYAKRSPGDTPVELSINDCLSDNSDIAPVNGSNYVFFSSTTDGGYRLYLGDISTGKRWRLAQFGLDASPRRAKLGANYYAGRR